LKENIYMKRITLIGGFLLGFLFGEYFKKKRNFIFFIRENFDGIPNGLDEAIRSGELCTETKIMGEVDGYFIYELTLQKIKPSPGAEFLEILERKTFLKSEKLLLN